MFKHTVTRTLQTLTHPSPCLRATRACASWTAAARVPSSSPIARQLPVQRWYSTAPESESKSETAGEAAAAGEPAAENPLQKELDTKKKELLDFTDRLKRSVADYRNLQEQTKREVQAARDFALQRFAKDLLDSIDNLDRALDAVPKEKLNADNQDLLNLHSGLKMTEEILLKTLAKHGLERFDPSEAGEQFDPNKHEATFQTPQPDKKDGSVFFCQSKGFLYNGRVLRAAKVGVVRNS